MRPVFFFIDNANNYIYTKQSQKPFPASDTISLRVPLPTPSGLLTDKSLSYSKQRRPLGQQRV